MLTTEDFSSPDAHRAAQGAVIPGLQAARQGYKDREVRLTGERFRVENRLADLVEAERCQFQENLQLEHRVGTESPACTLMEPARQAQSESPAMFHLWPPLYCCLQLRLSKEQCCSGMWTLHCRVRLAHAEKMSSHQHGVR